MSWFDLVVSALGSAMITEKNEFEVCAEIPSNFHATCVNPALLRCIQKKILFGTFSAKTEIAKFNHHIVSDVFMVRKKNIMISGATKS